MKTLLKLALVASGFGATVATAASIPDGEALAWKYHCMTCHGASGKSSSSRYPNLAGQNAAYIESRLKYFRSGEEPGNQMNGQAAPLSDEEIRVLADHYSKMAR